MPEDGSLSLGEILQNTAYFMFPLFLQLKPINFRSFVLKGGTWLGSCLRHCATSRKFAGLIPDGVTGIFH